MAERIQTVLYDLRNFLPAEKRKILVALWLSSNEGRRSAIREELDENFKRFLIVPQDYAIFLRVSQSVSWALEALRNQKDKTIVTVAIDVLEMNWKKDPSSFVKSVGDVEGITDLLDTVLPQVHVVRVFRALGRPVPLLPEHKSFVDALFRKIFPAFHSAATPLVRHASVAIDQALTAASVDVIRVVLHCSQASSAHRSTWTKLSIRRPEAVKEILLGQFRGLEPSPETGRVDNPKYLLFGIDEILHKAEDFVFWDRFLASYASYLSQNPLLLKADPIIASLDTAFLLRVAAIILRKSMKVEDKIIRVIALFQVLKVVMDRHGENGVYWSIAKAKDVISLACEEFGHSRWAAFWEITSPEELASSVGKPNILGLLLAVLKPFNYNQNFFRSSNVRQIVALLPRIARFPFCHILHVSKTGESLAEKPANSATLPTFESKLLSILHPTHGRPFLKIGIETRGLSEFVASWHSPARTGIDTQSLILASWVGAERGVLGDLGHADEAAARACSTEIKLYRDKASRAKQPADRLYYAKMALTVCKLSHSPSSLHRTLVWAFDRYAKDAEVGPEIFEFVFQYVSDTFHFDRFFAGPVGIYVSKHALDSFSLEALANWCTESDEVMRCGVRLFRIWINEPNHGQKSYFKLTYQYDTARKFCFNVLAERIKLLGLIYPTIYSDDKKLRQILLEPMVDIFLDLERFKVLENPDVFDFDLDNCLPQRLQDLLQVPRRLSPIILPFLLDFGQKRDDLYKEGRQKLGSLNTERLIERYKRTRWNQDDHSILPCRLALTSSILETSLNLPFGTMNYQSEKRHLFNSMDLSHGLAKQVEKVLFDHLDATLGSTGDSFGDWAPAQFQEALHNYLRASPNKSSMFKRIFDLFSRYERTEGGKNLSIFLLDSQMVTASISEDPALFVKVVGPWLPEYPPLDKPSKAFEFNFFEKMPPLINTDMGDETLIKALQNRAFSPNYNHLSYLQRIFRRARSYLYTHPTQIDLPVPLKNRVTILAVAWILSLLDIPTDSERIREVEDLEDPVLYAIRHVRLSAKTLERAAAFEKIPLAMLSLSLPSMDPRYISVFVGIVFSAEMVEAKIALAMKVLHVVRRLALPQLGLDQMWQMLNLPAMSSWHRAALTHGILRHQDPKGAKTLVEKLLVYSQEGQSSRHTSKAAEKTEAQENVGGLEPEQTVDQMDEPSGALKEAFTEETKDEAGEADPEEVKKEIQKASAKDPTFFKVSSEKLVMQILRTAFESGIVDFDDISWYVEKNMLTVSPAVFSSASDVLVAVVKKTWLLYLGGKERIWEPLLPYIGIAQRLSEFQNVTETKWAAIRENEKLPMPSLVEEYAVASSLIQYGLPAILRPSWAKNVVEPMLLGHVSSRTKWLRAAATREGGGLDMQQNIAGTYSSAIEFAQAYREYAPWFTYERVYNQDQVIDLIRSRIAPTSARAACQEFVRLVDKSHSTFWRGTVYGRAVESLTAYATRDESSDSDSALEIGILSPLAHGDILPSWLVDRLSATLTSIAIDLLDAENITFDPTKDPSAVMPLDAFNRFFGAHWHQSKAHSKLIRDLCVRYIEEAKEQERIKSSEGLHGGAAYWKTIVTLKIALSFNQESIDGLARALAEVISGVANVWYHALYLPDIVQSNFIFPAGHVLTKELARFVNKLTQQPHCPEELGLARTLTFQTAFAVLRANAGIVATNISMKGEIDELISKWKKHEDGSVRWLAQTYRAV